MKAVFSKVWIGCDHAGFALKKTSLERWSSELPAYEDLGTLSEQSVDYPDYAERVARKVAADRASAGILICGSGLGMCISANKIHGVRAVSGWDTTSARLGRAHNNANILCLGARLTGSEVAWDSILAFLTTPFEGGRHQKRVDGIAALEKSIEK